MVINCNIILVFIENCAIVIKNLCDKKEYRACDISCCRGNLIDFLLVNGNTITVDYNDIKNHEFGSLSEMKTGLLEELEACKNAVTVDEIILPEDFTLTVEKFGAVTFPMCKKSTGEECNIIWCLDEGVETYQEAGTDIKLTPAQFASAYEKCKDKKQFIARNCYYLTSEEDLPNAKKNFVWFDQWTDGVTICTVPSGEVPLADESNFITDLNLYTMGSKKLGALSVINSDINTKKGRPIDICGTSPDGTPVTVAEIAAVPSVAADLVALATKNVPDDGYEWALLGFEIVQHPAKKKVYCDLQDAEGMVTSDQQAFYALTDDSKQYITAGDSPDSMVKTLPKADACGCLDDRDCLLVDADFATPLTVFEDTAVEVCPIFVCVVVAGEK